SMISCSVRTLTLYSFPTRRSSDLLHIGARPFGGGVLLRGLLRQPVCVQLRGLSVELGAPGLCLGLLGRHLLLPGGEVLLLSVGADRKSTRLNSSHVSISYAVFCLN